MFGNSVLYYGMNFKQQDPAPSTSESDLVLSHEDEVLVAAGLKILLNSAETRNEVQNLMSNDSHLLAQIGGLDQGEDSSEAPSPNWQFTGPSSTRAWAHPSQSHRGANGEVPGAQTHGRHRQSRSLSPMEALAPFTPIRPAGVVRWGAPSVPYSQLPPASPLQHTAVPFRYQTYWQQGFMRKSHAKSTLPNASWPYPYQPPPKKAFLMNARKPKTIFTIEQMELLEMTFATTQHPSSVLRKQLAYVSGLPLKTIQTWFQNTRTRFNRKQKNAIPKQTSSETSSEKSSPVKSPSDSESPRSIKVSTPSPLDAAARSKAPQDQPSKLSSMPEPSHPLNPFMDICNEGDSSSTPRPITATPEPKFQPYFPPQEYFFCQPASQHQNSWNSLPIHLQQAGRPLSNHTNPSTDWYQSRQHYVGLPTDYCEESASWNVPNSGSANVSKLAECPTEFTPSSPAPNSPKYPYQYFAVNHPGFAEPTIQTWETIIPELSHHSMASSQQQQQQRHIALSAAHPTQPHRYSSPTPSPIQHHVNNVSQVAASCMVRSQSTHNGLSMQSTSAYAMSPRRSSYPRPCQSFSSFSACPTPSPPSDQSQFSHGLGHRTHQHGFSIPALPQDSVSPPWVDLQGFPNSESTGRFDQYRIPVAPASSSRSSHHNNDHQIIPSTNANNLEEDDTRQSGQLPQAVTLPMNPEIIPPSGNAQRQFSAQEAPTDPLHACDTPAVSATDEIALPSTPASNCSFGSCNTLYIDLDAQVDSH